MNKTALCYLLPNKKNEDSKEGKKINSVQDIKNLIADIDQKIEKREVLWLSSPFEIEAYFCDEYDNNYGLVFSWDTIKTKQHHIWYMPANLLRSLLQNSNYAK
jgi:hypothetical protein